MTTPKASPSRWMARASFDSPLGPLTAAATAQGVAMLWFDVPAALDTLPVDPHQPHLVQLRTELRRYWADPAHRFDVTLDLQGTDFQRAVWRALLAIPPGQTRSYGDIALTAGRARAVRAVGAACGANPVGIVVPCHRVIGRDGRLTGFAGGLARKAALLQHESAQAGLTPAFGPRSSPTAQAQPA